MSKHVVFSNSLTQMLMGKTGGSAAMLLNATGAGFTHGQQVGWHGPDYPLFSIKLADGRWVLAGLQTTGADAGRVMAQGLGFIDVCEWGTGKNMSQYFDEGGSQIIGTGSSLNLKTQLTYPAQWYPGQTYPGTATGSVPNPSLGGGGGGGSTNTGSNNSGSNNTGGGLGSGFLNLGNTNTGTNNNAKNAMSEPMNILLIVALVAGVGALVYYLAKKK